MHGYEVDFVSPVGGPVEFMMEPLGISSYTIKYENFLEKANNTLKPGEVDPRRYQAVYVGGGYGTLFDVASNTELMRLIGSVYDNGGVIGGCGHGPGGFANARLANGAYLVEGKSVAGFPNSTEQSKSWAMEGTLLPFLVEDQLRKNGAVVQNMETLADKHAVVVDQRIVSTMFLPASANVGEEMVRLLERERPESDSGHRATDSDRALKRRRLDESVTTGSDHHPPVWCSPPFMICHRITCSRFVGIHGKCKHQHTKNQSRLSDLPVALPGQMLAVWTGPARWTQVCSTSGIPPATAVPGLALVEGVQCRPPPPSAMSPGNRLPA